MAPKAHKAAAKRGIEESTTVVSSEPAQKVAKKDGESPEAVEKKPHVSIEPEPEELEKDAPADKRPCITDALVFDSANTTLNVLSAQGGRLLMALTDGGMHYLLAGARGNIGIKKGRYFYEVQIVDSFKGLYFEDGAYVADGKRTACPKLKIWNGKCVVGVLLNVDAKSPSNNTLSLFRNGVRVAGPVALPESLHGKPLFPHITFRNMTLRVHSGPEPLSPLPFKCKMWQGAAKDDASVEAPSMSKAKDGKHEALFPIGFPDEGTFDWLDSFLEKNPRYHEISDRMILDWAAKSGLKRQDGAKQNESADKPAFKFGCPGLDDRSVRRVMNSIVTAVPRNYIVMEVAGNLVQKERADILKRFPSQHYKRIAHVVMGEPTEDYKNGQHALLLKQKQAPIEKAWQVKKDQKEQQRQAKKRKKEWEKQQQLAKKKALAKKKSAEKKKEGEENAAEGAEDAKEEDEEKEDAEPEEPASEDEPMATAELTEEEQKKWFRPRTVPDLTADALSKFFANFSIPEKSEGFDEIKYEWQKEQNSKKYLTTWVTTKKLTARVNDLTPGKWFTEKVDDWSKKLADWKTKQKEFKAKNAGKKDDEDAKEVDIKTVDDIMDAADGEPLFSRFGPDDWALVLLRMELYLLIQAFPKDCDDEDRKIHISNMFFYYNRYWGKKLMMNNYGVKEDADIKKLIKDTVDVDEDTRILSLKMDTELESPDIFVKSAEESRRERQRRIDAGDDTSRLKFNNLVLTNLDMKAGRGKGWAKGN